MRSALFRHWVLVLAALLTALGGGRTAVAQSFPTQDLLSGAGEHVTWAATAPEAVRPGAAFEVTLTAKIADGWKMYAPDSPPPSRGASVSFTDLPEGFARQDGLNQAPPKEGYDPNFDTTVRYYEGEATLRAALALDAGVAPGAYEIGGAVEYMICTDRLCLPPTEAPFAVTVAVAEDAPALASGAAPTATPEEENSTPGGDAVAKRASATGALDAARAGGFWAFLLLAAGAGAAALLTPCVFPMIPLTVSYFTKHAAGRGGAVRLALVYGLTIVVTFTSLGALAALVFGASGAQAVAANPWVNLLIGLTFVFFALSLLGLFELRLPSGLVNYFSRQSDERAGYAGVLFMGLTLTLVSFSCTAPFVGGLLAATAGGAWTYPVVGMLVFSAVFALPFVVLALFPRGLGALPRSGAWMGAVKVTLGFVELVAALKFLSNADLLWGTGLLSRPLAVALAVVLFFLTGLYLIGKLRLKHEPAVEEIGAGRLLVAVAFFGLALYMVPGLLGAPLGRLDAYLPPRQVGDPGLLAATSAQAPSGEARFDWIENDVEKAFAEARAQGKPVFIDFTGYTCTNCRAMEANVFPQPAVARRLESDFVLLRLFTDDPEAGRRLQRYQLRLTGTTALPTYAIVRPEAQETPLRQISGVAEAERFARFLEEGAALFAQEERLASR